MCAAENENQFGEENRLKPKLIVFQLPSQGSLTLPTTHSQGSSPSLYYCPPPPPPSLQTRMINCPPLLHPRLSSQIDPKFDGDAFDRREFACYVVG